MLGLNQAHSPVKNKMTMNGSVGLPWWSSGGSSRAPNAVDTGSIPGQGTRSHMAAIKIWSSQINKYFLKEEEK